MKLLVMASATLLLSASTAMAADPVYISPDPVPVASAHDWSGFYAGISGGYGSGSVDPRFQNNGYEATVEGVLLTDPVSRWYDFEGCTGGVGGWGGDYDYCGDMDRLSGWFIGGQVGYNWQNGNIVFGVEADAFWSNIDSDGSSFWTYDYGGANYGDTATAVNHELEYFGTFRGRIGVAMDRFLPYVTGGLAWGHTETSVAAYNFNNIGLDHTLSGSASETLWGYAVGAGIEYAMTQRLSIKAEYLYIDLGDSRSNFQFSDGGAYNFNASNDLHTFKIGLNVAF